MGSNYLTHARCLSHLSELVKKQIAICFCNPGLNSHYYFNYRMTYKQNDDQLQSEVMLQLNLIKKQQQEIKKKRDELLEHQNQLKQELERVERELVMEREKFMKEITAFNNDFNLLGKKDDVLQNQIRSEMQSLQLEVDTLNEEILMMKQKTSWLMSMQTEKKSLEVELQDLQSHLAELEKELQDEVTLTGSLKAELLMVSQKPLTDSTCLRLKKELEAYKEGELEMLREALSTEIQFLRSKLSENASGC
ncbi:coiled-coil domain-containing protein 172 isoform X2 [Trichomycterus rosablanca]|uniref:coiled-coil domain-containing protein 172 isoform X2 n=1 Tax=Trichomycterus rosablanca TaxID=2290929 RepID=UPI002F356766